MNVMMLLLSLLLLLLLLVLLLLLLLLMMMMRIGKQYPSTCSRESFETPLGVAVGFGFLMRRLVKSLLVRNWRKKLVVVVFSPSCCLAAPPPPLF